MPGFLKLLVASLTTALILFTSSAFADSGGWRLSSPKGVVRVMQPGEAIIKGKDNMALPIGTVVTTGKDSSAVLSNGRQQIDLAADTRLTVAESSEGLTVIRQDTGTAFYQVDSKAMPHFRVDTTLLAAVVKGTGFTVSAGPDADMVHVAHGLVQVKAQQSDQAVDVRPGETARVERTSPFGITVAGTREASVAPAAVSIPPIDYAEASNNLLQPVAASSEAGRSNSSSGSADPGNGQAALSTRAAGGQSDNSAGNVAAQGNAANGPGNSNGGGQPPVDPATGGNGNGNGGGNPGNNNPEPPRGPRP